MQSRIYQFTFGPIVDLTTYIKSNVVEVCIKIAYFSLNTIEEFFNNKKNEPFNFHKKLKKIELEAKWSSNKFAVQKIGFTNEHYAYLIPTSHRQLSHIISYADTKPQGRDGYKIFNRFGHTDILSNTHPEATKDHKDLLASISLNSTHYLTELTALCESNFNSNAFDHGVPKDKIEKILHRLFAKIMIGLDLSDYQIAIIKKISEYSLNNTGNPFSHLTTFFSYQFRQINHEYHQMAFHLFQSKIKPIKKLLKDYKSTRTENNNYFLKKIVDLIAETKPHLNKIQLIAYINQISYQELAEYLQHPKIIRLPLILAGLSNLVSASYFVINNLHRSIDPHLMHELSEYLLHDNINVWHLKNLHLLCLHALNISTTPYIIRYFTERAQFGNIDIPMHTTVFISLVAEEKYITKDISIPRKYPFSPFSVGERACPAMGIVLPVIKHMALHLAKYSPNVLSTTLFKIVDKRNSELLEQYVKMDIDLNAQDKFGDTILHHAIKNNDVKSVRLLVKYGANLSIKNRSGYSPLGLAKYFNRKSCLEVLSHLPEQSLHIKFTR